MPKLETASGSHPGLVRTENEDACLAWGPDQGPWDALLVVADGMGGHAGGSDASGVAVEAFASTCTSEIRRGRDVPNALRQAFAAANRTVRQLGGKGEGASAPGTTLTCALVQGNRCYVGHVGDSRIYLVAPNFVQQLSEDDSWVADQVRQGRMTADEAMRSPFRNQLLQAVGTRAEIEPNLSEHELRPGDALVLCTDGLSEYVPAEEIRAALNGGVQLARAVDMLLQTALQRGGEDNVTIVAARLSGSAPLREPSPAHQREALKDTVPVPILASRRRVSTSAAIGLCLIALGLAGIVLALVQLTRGGSGGGSAAPGSPTLPAATKAATPSPSDSSTPILAPPDSVAAALTASGGNVVQITLPAGQGVLKAEAEPSHSDQLDKVPQGWTYRFSETSMEEIREGQGQLVLRAEAQERKQPWSPVSQHQWELQRDVKYEVRYESPAQGRVKLFTLEWQAPEASEAAPQPGDLGGTSQGEEADEPGTR
ncbi:MAG: serine/threonine-protein phosphatase [Armatimonadetes bacterium]|nr:serine/threonine-protein phosphatase [Armatimonadota bacterium]